MKIIGHRGAAGLAPENTITSITKGVRAGANFVEIDVRLTHDNKLVLSHDPTLKREYDVDLKISEHSLKNLRIPCPDLPTLEDALKATKTEGAIVELKEFIEPERVLSVTKKFPELDIRFASFNHHVIRALKKTAPESFCYLLEHHSPFEIINAAGNMKADGIGLNYGVLNPLTYFLAKRKKLHIYIYTLNKAWIATILAFLYRDIYICTDRPDQLRYLKKYYESDT